MKKGATTSDESMTFNVQGSNSGCVGEQRYHSVNMFDDFGVK